MARVRQPNDEGFRYVQENESLDNVNSSDHIEPLTWRETEILRLLAEGMSPTQIADQLGIRLRSVEAHQEVTYRKLRVKNRMQALREGARRGLLGNVLRSWPSG